VTIVSDKDHEDLFWDDLQKQRLHMILQTLGAIFFKSNNIEYHFCSHAQGVCPVFPEFCKDFNGFCPDFQQIQNFPFALAPPATPPVCTSLLY